MDTIQCNRTANTVCGQTGMFVCAWGLLPAWQQVQHCQPGKLQDGNWPLQLSTSCSSGLLLKYQSTSTPNQQHGQHDGQSFAVPRHDGGRLGLG